MANLPAIAAVDGVDGVFFGPADLAASMGLLGGTAEPAVQDAIARGIDAVARPARRPARSPPTRRSHGEYLDLGALFVAVGVDTTLLVRAARELAAAFKGAAAVAALPAPGIY